MELKYYLRGLGLGIVITAIIMGITSSRSRAMTDDEVIARAKQLGMIEDRVLSETASEDSDNSDEVFDAGENTALDENDSAKEDGSGQAGDTPESVPDDTPGNMIGDAADENTPPDENTISDEPEDVTAADNTSAAILPDDGETGQEEAQETSSENAEADRQPEASDTPLVVTVGSGDGSYTVSKKLEDVGAVASASAFDTFLCENGYDKKIRAGSYTIPAGAGDEQIARMITGLE